jgi:tyrosine-protein phosphatase SIW14
MMFPHGGTLMPRYLSYIFGILIVGLLVLGPLMFATYERSRIRHFHVVRDGVLYRSGQMSLAGLRRVVHDYSIKTVITLRDAYHAGEPPPNPEEEEYSKAQEINYHRITPRSWWPHGDMIPADRGVRQFLSVMDDPANYPVLIHCFAGIHRTGAYCAVYRMEYQHWTNDEAIAEMKACGYINLDDELDVLGYLEHYYPRWKGPAPKRDWTIYHQPEPGAGKSSKRKSRETAGPGNNHRASGTPP